MNWYIEVLKKYAVFNGRASRSEFWHFALVNTIISMALFALKGITGIAALDILYFLYWLAVLLPVIGVGIRRLHDTGHSGWWMLIDLIPVIGLIVLIVFWAQEGNFAENQYGPIPNPIRPRQDG